MKNGAVFDYIYDQRNDDANLTYRVEVCTNLMSNSWADATALVVTNTTVGEFDNVTHTIPATQSQSYIRLKVTNQ